MDQPKLGQLITDAGAGRDAIHVAVAPVIAAERLSPGEHVGFVAGQDSIVTGDADNPVGIVDPYLKAPVKKGQMFYLLLYPQTVTSLRHVWSHPAFEEEGAKPAGAKEERDEDASLKWLRDYAEQMDLTYNRLMEGAAEYVASMRREGYGEYIVDGGRYEGARVPDEFWDHYERVTGQKVEDNNRGTFFSCSC